MENIDTYFVNHRGKKCLILGSKGMIGRKLANYCKSMEMDVISLNIGGSEENDSIVDIGVESGNEASMKKGFQAAKDKLGEIDYLLCNFDLERLRKEEPISCENWDTCLKDWCFNYFLFLKIALESLDQGHKRQIIYFNSAYGYTGEGEGEGCLLQGASLFEATCSSAITGMMTAIARSIIPKGYSVNGIALGENIQDKWPRIEWALNLWLSGMGDYSCGEIYRVY